MNRRNLTLVITLCLSILLLSSSVYAGRGDKSGTAAAPQLLIPIGPRMIALGGSSIATAKGIDATFWNPAGLAKSERGSNAMFSHMTHLADIGVDYVAASSTFEEFGTLGISVKSLSIGDIDVTSEEQPDGSGEIISPTFFTLGLTFAKQLADRVSIGLTLNHITEKMGLASSSGIAFNVGVQYAGVGGLEGLSLGVVVKNIGPQMKYEGSGLLRSGNVDEVSRSSSFYQITASSSELPSVMEIGLGYSNTFDESNELQFTSLFQNNNFTDDEYKLGVEYSYADMLFLRGGYSFAAQTTGLETIYGETYGIGFNKDLGELDVSIDYAYQAAQFFGGNHTFGIMLGF